MTFLNNFMGHPMHDDHLKKQIVPAIVINNKDPKYANRVQVRISDYHKNVKDEHLPWASNIGFAPNGYGKGLGGVFIPPIGANVAVFFPEETDTNIYYIGGIPGTQSMLDAFKSGYPNTYGWVDIGGNLFIVDPLAPNVSIILSNGNYLSMDANSYNVKFPTINFDCSQFNCSGEANFAKPVSTNSGNATSLPAKSGGSAYTQPDVSNKLDY